jgi:hypothetical protein
LWEVLVSTLSLPLPSTAATVYDATICAVSSIPLPLPLTTTTIAAANNCHCRCHTVDNYNCQKSAVILSLRTAMAVIVKRSGSWWWPRQWWPLLTVFVIDRGSSGIEG